jgi:hypothetical protein
MDLVTLALAKKYTDKAIAQAAVGDIDVEAYVKEAVDDVVGSASEEFNSLGEMETALGNKVDKTTTINNKPLSSNISLGASDVGAVPTSRTVNGKALSGNVTLSASDVKALPDTTTIPTTLASLAEDATHRVVTDAEKTTWNAKSNFSGSYNDLTNKPTIPSTAGLASETYVNNAVAGKVDANTLATVATSGSYNDLNDKPTIPSIAGLATEEYVNNAVANIVLISEGGKRFKLTVDDAGALTATEITE